MDQIIAHSAEKTTTSNAGRTDKALSGNDCTCHENQDTNDFTQKNNYSVKQCKRMSGFSSENIPAIVHDVLQSPGNSLDQHTLTLMGNHFGHNFRNVRVHDDAKAAESARSVNAVAYAVGHNVVFGAGEYAPS